MYYISLTLSLFIVLSASAFAGEIDLGQFETLTLRGKADGHACRLVVTCPQAETCNVTVDDDKMLLNFIPISKSEQTSLDLQIDERDSDYLELSRDNDAGVTVIQFEVTRKDENEFILTYFWLDKDGKKTRKVCAEMKPGK